MKNLFNIKDKVVVITGGTGVLGKGHRSFIWQKKVRKVVILGRKAEIGDAIAGRNQGKRWRSHVPDNRRDEP